MLGMQTRESFLEWNDDYTTDSHRGHTPSRNPVIIEIAKTAPQLGNDDIMWDLIIRTNCSDN